MLHIIEKKRIKVLASHNSGQVMEKKVPLRKNKRKPKIKPKWKQNAHGKAQERAKSAMQAR